MLSKCIDGVVIQFAKSDAEWSASVLAKNDGKCVLCGRTATPAHIISRRYKNTRLALLNGQPLCIEHHNHFDSLSGAAYEKMATLLVGKAYKLLSELSKQKDEVKVWE